MRTLALALLGALLMVALGALMQLAGEPDVPTTYMTYTGL